MTYTIASGAAGPSAITYIAPENIFQANTAGTTLAVLNQSYPTAVYVISTLPPEPLIDGTNIPVFRIAALLRGGMTVIQVMEDFPSLTRREIEEAEEYADEHENIWKEYPAFSLKRLLQDSGFSKL
jgi:uncharacterized protein (DUF433 family)